MRLKKILEEKNQEKLFEKLHEELNSGKWIVRETKLYRGTDRSAKKVKVKDVRSRSGREPKDTESIVDELIHLFYEKCFSEYPNRRGSVFASTSAGSAKFYGKPHVVFPHKNAKISGRDADPHNVFEALSSKIKRLKKVWLKNKDKIDEIFDDFPEEDANKIRDLIFLFSGYDLNLIENENITCPKELAEYTDQLHKKYEEFSPQSLPFKKFLGLLDGVAYSINRYFENLELGYPKSDGFYGEVLVDGKYLQVEKNFFDEYYENFGHDLDWQNLL